MTRAAGNGDEAIGLGARLAGPPACLDGAVGTEIERRGGDAGLPLWSARTLLDAPELLAGIHTEYAQAGAEILVAETFRTQRRTLARAGLEARAGELTAAAVALARRAAASAAGPVWIVGSAPPLEDCYRPDLVPDDEALRREHAEHAEHLAAAGVDGVFAETLNTVREAGAAVRAAREAGLVCVASFVCGGDGRLLSGEPLAAALDASVREGATAVGVNCLPPDAVAACLPLLADAGLPFVVYANLGAPEPDGGFERSGGSAPEAFASEAASWLDAGARAVGGCCGTTPSHVAAIERVVSVRRGPRTQFASPRA